MFLLKRAVVFFSWSSLPFPLTRQGLAPPTPALSRSHTNWCHQPSRSFGINLDQSDRAFTSAAGHLLFINSRASSFCHALERPSHQVFFFLLMDELRCCNNGCLLPLLNRSACGAMTSAGCDLFGCQTARCYYCSQWHARAFQSSCAFTVPPLQTGLNFNYSHWRTKVSLTVTQTSRLGFDKYITRQYVSTGKAGRTAPRIFQSHLWKGDSKLTGGKKVSRRLTELTYLKFGVQIKSPAFEKWIPKIHKG